MKKVQLVFVNTYIKYNKETKEKTLMFNYAVVSGDVKQYVADKEAEGFHSVLTQEEGREIIPVELLGKPRFASTQELSTLEIERTKRTNGVYGWFVDDLDAIMLEAKAKTLPKFARDAFGKELAVNAIAEAKASALAMRVAKAKAALLAEGVNDLSKS